MADKIEEHRSAQVVIKFDGERCIHSRNCVLGNPQVFVPNAPGAWIHPEAATAEQVAALAHTCPSGAITYERLDGGPQEAPPKVNVVRVLENGPLAIHAEMHIGGETRLRAALCRCGASQSKPFCDGSHTAAKFSATGEPPSAGLGDALEIQNGPLTITCIANGPLHISGNLEICSGTGRTIERTTETWLCRCGQSKSKPFCDGTHKKVGFQAA